MKELTNAKEQEMVDDYGLQYSNLEHHNDGQDEDGNNHMSDNDVLEVVWVNYKWNMKGKMKEIHEKMKKEIDSKPKQYDQVL
jgi:hypothetical protein